MTYFTMQEILKTNTGLPNVPSRQQSENLLYTRDKMDKVREVIGRAVNVNSWFRSPEVNKATGGVPTSGHLTGYCVDFWVKGMTNQEICDLLDKAGIEYDQLIDEFNGSTYWVHISFDPRARGQRLKARKINGKMHYTTVGG